MATATESNEPGTTCRRKRGRTLHAPWEIAALAAAARRIAAEAFEVSERELLCATRSKAHVAFARQTAMYLAHVVCGLSVAEVAKAFERNRTTVAHACNVIEDRRDERMFDYTLERMEEALDAAIQAPKFLRPDELETKSCGWRGYAGLSAFGGAA